MSTISIIAAILLSASAARGDVPATLTAEFEQSIMHMTTYRLTNNGPGFWIASVTCTLLNTNGQPIDFASGTARVGPNTFNYGRLYFTELKFYTMTCKVTDAVRIYPEGAKAE